MGVNFIKRLENHRVLAISGQPQLDINYDLYVSGTLYANTFAGGSVSLNDSVPYTGATKDVDLGNYNLVTTGSISAGSFIGSFYGIGELEGNFTGSSFGYLSGTLNYLDKGTVYGQLAFWSGNSWITIPSTRMIWDNTNRRLGIMTNSPTEALTISGNIALTGSVDGYNISDVHTSRVRASINANQTIPSTSLTTVNYLSEEYDGLNEYNTAGLFTAKHSGYYFVRAGVVFQTGGWTSGNAIRLELHKNGSNVYSILDHHTFQNTGSFNAFVKGSDNVYIGSNENILIRVYHNSPNAQIISYSSSYPYNNYAIHRLS